MFRKHPSKKSSQSALEVVSLQKVIVKLDEPSEEALSGGAIALPSFLSQMNKAEESLAAGSIDHSQSGIKYPVIVRFGLGPQVHELTHVVQ